MDESLSISSDDEGVQMKEQANSSSPKHNILTKEQRLSYQSLDRSPGSDQDIPHSGYRERQPTQPIPPSISAHSMKEYYQSERPAYPPHYRHSQTDLTEWEEHQQHYGSNAALQYSHLPQRRAGGAEREVSDRYAYRNGNARENGDWEEAERPRSNYSARRPDTRYGESGSTVSPAVLNHYSGYNRRPVNRSSNLLSATLCLLKELDYSSLEVVEHAVRCRIDELASE